MSKYIPSKQGTPMTKKTWRKKELELYTKLYKQGHLDLPSKNEMEEYINQKTWEKQQEENQTSLNLNL